MNGFALPTNAMDSSLPRPNRVWFETGNYFSSRSPLIGGHGSDSLIFAF